MFIGRGGPPRAIMARCTPHDQQPRDGNASSIPAGYSHRGESRRFQVETRAPLESASQAAAGDAER